MTVLRTIVFISALLLPAVSQAQPADVPEAITRYYATHNAVAAYSTPEERMRLASFVSAEAVEEATRSDRLAHVYRLMQRLGEQTLEPDAEMVRTPQKHAAPLPVASDVFEVRRVQRRGASTLTIEVTTYALTQGDNLRFIAAYEQGSDPTDRLFASVQPPQVHTSVHEWVRRGDRWLRKSAGLTLLHAPGS